MPLYIFSGGVVSGSGVSGLTPNEALFGGGGGLIAQSTNFKFDGTLMTVATRAVVGGTADPGSQALAVSGTVGLANPGASVLVTSGTVTLKGTVANAAATVLQQADSGLLSKPSGNTVLGGTSDPGSRMLAVSGSVGIANPGGTALVTSGTLSFLGTVTNAAGTLMTLNDVSGLMTRPSGNTVLGGTADGGHVLDVTGSVSLTNGGGTVLQTTGTVNFLGTVSNAAGTLMTLNGTTGLMQRPLGNTVLNGTNDPGSRVLAVSGSAGFTGAVFPEAGITTTGSLVMATPFVALTGTLGVTGKVIAGTAGTSVGGASAPMQTFGAGNTLNLVRDTSNSVEFAFGVVSSRGEISTQTNHQLHLRTNNGSSAIVIFANTTRVGINATADPGSVTMAVSGNLGLTGYVEAVPAAVGTPATTWTTGATTTQPQGFFQVHVSGTSFYVPLYR